MHLLSVVKEHWIAIIILILTAILLNRSRKASHVIMPIPPAQRPPRSEDGKFSVSTFAELSVDDPLIEEVLDALERHNKIEAIKLLRAAKDLGLKDAKDMVERIEKTLHSCHPTRSKAE